MTEIMGEIILTEEEQLIPYEENNDPNAKAHVVNAGGNPHIGEPDWTARDIIDYARMNGVEVIALCGYKWVPKHNPDKHDACKTCLELWSKAGA